MDWSGCCDSWNQGFCTRVVVIIYFMLMFYHMRMINDINYSYMNWNFVISYFVNGFYIVYFFCYRVPCLE